MQIGGLNLKTIQALYESGVVAILRGIDLNRIIPIVQALNDGGIKAVEVTLNHPDSLQAIRTLVKQLGEDNIIGAGTVLDPESARAAIFEGASFIISPSLNRSTIETTKRYGAVSIPGAFTPTEILTAFENGADIVKVYPATSLGISFLKDISGPFPHIPLMPTGGITLENIGEYLQGGAVVVGVGSSLVNTSQKIDKDSLLQLTQRAKNFIEEYQKAKQLRG